MLMRGKASLLLLSLTVCRAAAPQRSVIRCGCSMHAAITPIPHGMRQNMQMQVRLSRRHLSEGSLSLPRDRQAAETSIVRSARPAGPASLAATLEA